MAGTIRRTPGNSAAAPYGELVRMVECRDLTQLGEFLHALAG